MNSSQNSHPALDERGIGRYHDTELMACVAIRLGNRGEGDAALAALVLPGVLDRVVAIQDGEAHA